ncbi:N-acetylglucosamine-6-phosphate deacetylase [Acidipila sp. EB88]|uniref:N-acetylglucosamine-6-phosphate deacetylase n=1 Tax=Acidipila sp. EB88 TaxID=2305226 RepID=UPI000F5EA3DD|nr:N-acetylglucosamine-6-phosphate deacetylase [Acidipila sp. EB88]RRA47543.1 N-acetylglucosamine-6-phosphate deacetylase [Acidipila sp. EB88]
MKTLITAAHLVTPTGTLPEPILLVEDGHILAIHSRDAAELPQADLHRDYPGATLAPTYFDVHIHGCCGHDVMEGTAEAVETVNRFLPKHGVGAYLPTTMTAPKDVILRGLAGLARVLAAPTAPGQARPLGLHFEGPFLSHSKRGAHPTRDLLAPSIAFFDAMWQAAEGHVRLMTVAPELPGALELITHATSRGVRVSIGHSDGSSADAHAAIAAGAVSATHTFNAMRRLDHREPGLLGAVLSSDALYAELVCDGIHVDPAVVQLFARAKPADRAILITDAMSAAGMPDGNYKLGELDVRVTAGRAVTGDDTLAGSTLTLENGVRNYAQFANVPLPQAARAASSNPAHMAGFADSIGALTIGRFADFNVLSASGALEATYLGGIAV